MNVKDVIYNNFVTWMDGDAENGDIVISSRIRLARNLREIPFPHLLDQAKGEDCLKIIKGAWQESPAYQQGQMELETFDHLSSLDRQMLVEKHLISPGHAETNSSFRGVVLNQDGSLSTMINEEDHLRIQCLLPGLQLDECYTLAQGLDDELESQLEYAFDERRGYLTACPTNVGTGLRASVMLHLPAMQMTGQTNQILQNIGQLGMTVRGLYGEGTEVAGNFFQMSNQITMGQTEEEICTHLRAITVQLVEQERLLRERLQVDLKYQLEDKIGRAYGILSHARIINSNEALSLLSDVRLGIDMGILQGIKPNDLNELVVAIRPAHLQKRAEEEMDATGRDIKRAQVIQEKLQGIQ
ncbi:ATP:guanido phosphotransferase, bacterial [Syntrophomonas zehnderi OL-4]|uniref:Protein-arginine kinase n=1 Tax=Syntrophomonas zehnderi OL-4 TaxID=690567 RepID=A0A0E4GA72_9FIRM|nr:protein arginine kinase [Syntrophomonas zehnderi]CFX03508.1 ATP:guanido phosphotransferase, bacterial [Syntrophomonas zehnderi OL-4]